MSAAVAAASAAANRRNSATTTAKKTNYTTPNNYYLSLSASPPCNNRYEIYKCQDWNKFLHYLKNYSQGRGQPPLSVRRCSGSHVLGFLKYLDQFGGTKVHKMSCEYYGQAYSSVACSCPLKEAWSSLQGVVGRLRVAFEEYGGSRETNPFGSPLVWLYLEEVKVAQAKARGCRNEENIYGYLTQMNYRVCKKIMLQQY
ncbi:hypothetical protein DCAR_0208821 [Daucus carota subsp. sativus]|uniref:ALOG domain-containing protein n=1 Tax=Daucus carota subsp. sativus TaxID=79200 RepID=A0A166ETW8_DAUCS|nr:hypothetical protein DCAR_0208821 [Daucus carota subsp. sativus]